jgi:thioredoxin reductase (NADPH)
MAKPAILTLDDDADVLRAVERDLRSEYGSEFRIVRADSGEAALELLQALKRRGDPAALLLVDQRMPAMTGVEFLQKAVEIYPDAKSVLLTAYADTEAAISAINQRRSSTRSSPTCSTTGDRPTGLRSRVFASWGTSGLLPLTA